MMKLKDSVRYVGSNDPNYDNDCKYPSLTIEELHKAIYDLDYDGYCNHISKTGLIPIISAEAFGKWRVEFTDQFNETHTFDGNILYANHQTLYVGEYRIPMETLEKNGFFIMVMI